jgi:hypothetical protein
VKNLLFQVGGLMAVLGGVGLVLSLVVIVIWMIWWLLTSPFWFGGVALIFMIMLFAGIGLVEMTEK